ncbi:MAG: hypothetical protein AAGF85_00545 [Bacteroidota bacterium]
MKKTTSLFTPDHVRIGKDLHLLPEVELIFCEIWIARSPTGRKSSSFTFTVHQEKIVRVPIIHSGLLGKPIHQAVEQLVKKKWQIERII